MGVQNLLESISDNCCLALCYIYVGFLKVKQREPTEQEMVNLLFSAYFLTEIIERDAYVKDANYFIESSFYTKCNVKKVEDETEIKKYLAKDVPVIAFYSYHKGEDAKKIGHFVVQKGNKIIFNSLDYSKNVSVGKITSLRVVEWLA